MSATRRRSSWLEAVLLAGCLVVLGWLLFAVPSSPLPAPPSVHCPGALRLQGVILPYRPDFKGPLLLAVDDGGGQFSFFLTPQPADYNTGEVVYHWVYLGVCRPIVRTTIVPSAFLVGPPAATGTIANVLAELWQQLGLVAMIEKGPGGRELVVNRLLPPNSALQVRLTVSGRTYPLTPPFLGVSLGKNGPFSYFRLPRTLPAGRALLQILAPPDWRGTFLLHVPS